MLIAPDQVFLDKKWEEYVLQKKIGGWWFWTVYLVKKEWTEELFAVKTLPIDYSEYDRASYDTIMNEWALAPKVKSAYVVKNYFFHDWSKYEWLPPYILMEYIDWHDLSKELAIRIESEEHYEKKQLISAIKKLSKWMIAIHKELIHRDIKPWNILVSSEWKLKITDFWLAKLTDEYTRSKSFKWRWTLKYIPPEWRTNRKNSPQMDIYSMWLVFYELATLTFPYEFESNYKQEDWKNVHLTQPAKDIFDVVPEIDKNIGNLIMKMIHKDTKYRFNSFDEVLDYLWEDQEEVSVSILDSKIQKKHQALQSKREQVEIAKNKEIERQKALQEHSDIVRISFENNIGNKIQSLADYLTKKSEEFKYEVKPKDKITWPWVSMWCSWPGTEKSLCSATYNILTQQNFEYKRKPTDHELRYCRSHWRWCSCGNLKTAYYKREIFWKKIIWYSDIGLSWVEWIMTLFLVEDEESTYWKWYISEYSVWNFHTWPKGILDWKEILYYLERNHVMWTEYNASVKEFDFDTYVTSKIDLN